MADQMDITSVAEVAAEAAKFGTQTVKTTEKILKGLSKILGEPAQDAAGIIGDKLKYLRWERQLRYTDKVNELLEEMGVTDTKAVSPKFALPIITNASLEEDDNLQDLWAKLTANAMDPNFPLELRYAYLEIIKSLNPLDVKMLNLFFSVLAQDSNVDWDQITNYNFDKKQICTKLSISDSDYQISMFNLFRVQCMAPAVLKATNIILANNENPSIYKGIDVVTMTPLGINFVKTCISNRKDKVRI